MTLKTIELITQLLLFSDDYVEPHANVNNEYDSFDSFDSDSDTEDKSVSNSNYKYNRVIF